MEYDEILNTIEIELVNHGFLSNDGNFDIVLSAVEQHEGELSREVISHIVYDQGDSGALELDEDEE